MCNLVHLNQVQLKMKVNLLFYFTIFLSAYSHEGKKQNMGTILKSFM